MPNGGAMRNCALGLCCPPPTQQKALAVFLKRGIAEQEGLAAWTTDELIHFAGYLMEAGVIGAPSPAEAEHLQRAGSPTEEELDRMLEE